MQKLEALATDGAEAGRLARLTEEIVAGRTDLAAVIGITEGELEAVYALGHRFYSAGRYGEALSFFRFLCMHRYTDPRYWFGLGAASEMLGDSATAVRAYGLAALLNDEDPQIPLRAAKCLIKLDQPAAAISALESVLELSGEKPQHKALAQWASLTLRRLRPEAAGKGGFDA
ncbi:SycD/LcrH family type III secretion system chaperone [Rhizobium etli]|uniref:Type III secretion system low calcium response chaperone LcrH/SycD n=1 Tax=Rhizobium etli TaxID=29449 RepID=A0A7W7EHV9_RHIET|nr:SycD/LcrH family type III secretion system chaperone [Rhizobium etli]AJC82201.1 type III secretion system low calcium response chaperone LcrH/SycD family protein [Rhizobium etli bv. phaseoli str. IE4803]MBB4483483.1 type III secretion system low calcium response chaperone LcrH/SycD [Rhizobium etli]MBB4539296.1 type III secretion system low calcium response chaperone LcrH/SycD [Rhizobium etli]